MFEKSAFCAAILVASCAAAQPCPDLAGAVKLESGRYGVAYRTALEARKAAAKPANIRTIIAAPSPRDHFTVVTGFRPTDCAMRATISCRFLAKDHLD